ncbi:MAG: hypothetical protein QM802_23430 [Agriterribacter sp.]
MKKLIAILLLSVYLFNLAGYALLFQCLIDTAGKEMTQRLDNNAYNNKELIEIKVPLHMPYLVSSNEFERVDGQLELKGITYTYVKRKVMNDTLHLLCLPDFDKTSLYKAKAAYANQNTDAASGKKDASSTPVKKLNKGSDYNYIIHYYSIACQQPTAGLMHAFVSTKVPVVFIHAPVQPPDFI